MNVVLEGPDAGGKSTLALNLSQALTMRVQAGSGPPKSPDEIESRLASYLELRGVIFDRHPAISQPIYSQIRNEPLTPAFNDMVDRFYETRPLIIYCRSTSVARHVVKDGENPDHVRKLTERYDDLVQMYDRWALQRADLIYRIGHRVADIVDVVRVIAG